MAQTPSLPLGVLAHVQATAWSAGVRGADVGAQSVLSGREPVPCNTYACARVYLRAQHTRSSWRVPAALSAGQCPACLHRREPAKGPVKRCSAIPWPPPPDSQHPASGMGSRGPPLWPSEWVQRPGTGGASSVCPGSSAGAPGPQAAHPLWALSLCVEWPHRPSSTLYRARLDMRLIRKEGRRGLRGTAEVPGVPGGFRWPSEESTMLHLAGWRGAAPCAQCWGHSSAQGRPDPCPHGVTP
ncbi:hypothetical protein H1C71_012114 [Ictidomys tridecemlineatus]|nr:hypothetical protein H1C71_012114 [Ictidomys tridecemlineatus]